MEMLRQFLTIKNFNAECTRKFTLDSSALRYSSQDIANLQTFLFLQHMLLLMSTMETNVVVFGNVMGT